MDCLMAAGNTAFAPPAAAVMFVLGNSSPA